jgi:hypothetical protein
VLVVVVLVVGWRLATGAGDGDGAGDPEQRDRVAIEREGSEEVAETATEDLRPDDEPVPSYRIVYRITEASVTDDEGRAAVSTEEHWVRRPFESRRVQTEDGRVVNVQETSLGRFAVAGGPDTQPTVLAVGPGVAGADLRLDSVLDAALDEGLLEPREQREVAGVRCQVYRVGDPVAGGILVPADDADDYTDVCFDARGLLLEEWWVLGGRPYRQRVATTVEVAPLDDDDLLSLPEEPTAPAAQGGGSGRPIDPASSPPGTFYEPTVVPEGFEHVVRFSVVPPQAELFSDPLRREEIVAHVTDVWRRGTDILVLDQGGRLGTGGRAYPSDPAAPRVEVDDLGEGEVTYSLHGTSVRVDLPGGRFVRIAGTIDLDDLLEVGRGLEEVEGTAMVFLDEDDEPETDGDDGHAHEVDGG